MVIYIIMVRCIGIHEYNLYYPDPCRLINSRAPDSRQVLPNYYRKYVKFYKNIYLFREVIVYIPR